jgi:hypothetical protein
VLSDKLPITVTLQLLASLSFNLSFTYSYWHLSTWQSFTGDGLWYFRHGTYCSLFFVALGRLDRLQSWLSQGYFCCTTAYPGICGLVTFCQFYHVFEILDIPRLSTYSSGICGFSRSEVVQRLLGSVGAGWSEKRCVWLCYPGKVD